MTKNRIVLTGGGSTGHVSVNLALIPILKRDGWDIHYIGSKDGIERELIKDIEGIKYHAISTGKLRRSFKKENFTDAFKVLWGSLQSVYKIFRIKPDVAFSKGGFVSVPVLFGCFINRIPAISHESDLTPGLANKLVQPFVKTIYTTFEDTPKHIKSNKGKFLGPIIREGLLNGDAEKAKEFLKIKSDKPTLLVMGGSLGARFINDSIRQNLDTLTQSFNIVHATGETGFDNTVSKDGYYQFTYIKDELKDILALSDIVVTRSGSNAIFEFLYYKLPMLLIPLPLKQSRGDQIENANDFEKHGFGKVLRQETATPEEFIEKIFELYSNRDEYIKRMDKFTFEDNINILYRSLLDIKK